MAAAANRCPSFADKAEKELTCPVCYEIFIPPWIPKELSCIHVICLVCLGSMTEGGRPSIACPECRKVTRVPPQGIKGLKTNQRVLNLAESFYEYGTQKDQNPAPGCDTHENEINNLVCIRCKTFICSICLEEAHNSHPVKAIRTFQKQCKQEEGEVKAQLETKKTNLKEYSDHLSKMEEKVQEALQIETDKLHKHMESIIEKLKQKEADLEKELHETTKKENLKSIQSERSRVESEIEKIDQMKDQDGDSTLDSLSDDYYLHQQELYLAKMRSLLDKNTQPQVKFDMNIQQFQPESPQLNIGVFKKMGNFQFLSSFGVFRDPRSLALSSTGLIVILDWEVTVGCLHVFEYSGIENAYVRKETLKLTEYDSSCGNPVDLAIAFMDKFLVVCGTCVDVFSSSGQYEESLYTKKCFRRPKHQRSIKKHLHLSKGPQSFRGPKPKHTSKAHCLVITKDNKIIVGNVVESTLTIFDSDYNELQSAFKIPIEGFQPIRLATNDKQLVMADTENNMLCGIDINTKQITFRVKIVSPQGLCFDSSDTVLVTAGTKHGSVEQFCSKSGQWLGQVVSGLNWPLDIAMVSDDRAVVLAKDTANVFNINRL